MTTSTCELISLWQAGHHVVRVATGPYNSTEDALRLKQMSLQLDRDGRPPTRLVLRDGANLVCAVDDARVSVFQLSPQILRDFGESLSLLTQQSNYGHVRQPLEECLRYPACSTLILLASCVAPCAPADVAAQTAAGHEASN